jgi:hypothetical protein
MLELCDAELMRGKVIELQGAIMQAQGIALTTQADLVTAMENVSAFFEQELAELEDWETRPIARRMSLRLARLLSCIDHDPYWTGTRPAVGARSGPMVPGDFLGLLATKAAGPDGPAKAGLMAPCARERA